MEEPLLDIHVRRRYSLTCSGVNTAIFIMVHSTSDGAFQSKIVFQIFPLKIAMQGRRRQLLSSVRANTCDIGNVSTNIAYKCLKNNRGTYHRIETAPKDCMGQGWDYGIFVLIYNSQFADYIFRLYSWLLFTPESADFSDKSLIQYVQNGSAPAEALALANMSRQFKMKTNSGSKSCFLKIQHIDQVCSSLSELELVVSYETDCHFFF